MFRGILDSETPLSLYSHIPFCRTKCSYCAFNTYTGMEHLISSYLTALCGEIEQAARRLDAANLDSHTLYFGGGTPSLLSPPQVGLVIDAAARHCNLRKNAEITLEVNPGDGTLDGFNAMRSAGVTRISIGVQSAQSRDLEHFRRRHTFEQAADTYRLARAAGFDNVSVDLIYGAPHQILVEWSRTLDTILAWQPDHISMYSLSLEDGTIMTRQVREGHLPSPDPDLAADMYDLGRERLGGAGFTHYEISNWARPGKECVHNLQYWLNQPYLGFGAGAHGCIGGARYWNVRAIPDYIRRVLSGATLKDFPLTPAADGYEWVDPAAAMAESAILGLRLLARGLDRGEFEARHGVTLEQQYGKVIGPLGEAGLLEWSGSALRLTPRAYLVSNQVFYRFMRDA